MSFYIKKHIQKQCFYIAVLHLNYTVISVIINDYNTIYYTINLLLNYPESEFEWYCLCLVDKC